MDRYSNNKVYINPNFKGNLFVQPLSTNYSNMASINKHVEVGSSDPLSCTFPGNRKIYVNPNFIPKSNVEQPRAPLEETNNKVNVSNQSKYKYSLVRNVASSNIQNRVVEHNKNININVSESEIMTDNFKPTPVTKSRYSIIRKRNQFANGVMLEQRNKPSCDNKNVSPLVNLTNSAPQGSQINSCNLPSGKIVKIKISKYKTIPISYINKQKGSPKIKDAKMVVKKVDKFVSTLQKSNNFRYININRPSMVNRNSPSILKSDKDSARTVCQNSVSKSKIAKTNFQINNIPCQLFKKYGTCLRQTYGHCQYLHDRRHVALCRKFLKGICHDNSCSLSHELTAKKMPVCYFYLKGICTKDICPYVHVKMSENAKVCPNFLKGYCENGASCTFRHVLNSWNGRDNKKTTHKQLFNQSVRIKQVRASKKKRKSEQVNEHANVIQDSTKCDDHRYYKETITNDSTCQIKPSRCKLGNLPSFIQL